MTENDFTLCDRIAKIKAINGEYNLLQNAYISFSGGKDSVACSKLIDLALPGNKIPRVFINTGIEYSAIVKFVQKNCHNSTNAQHTRDARRVRISVQVKRTRAENGSVSAERIYKNRFGLPRTRRQNAFSLPEGTCRNVHSGFSV